MKKFFILLMAAFLAVGFAGTAGATDYKWNLVNANTSQVWASPVTDAGVSVYVLTGGPVDAVGDDSGATMIIINPTTGTSVFYGGALLSGASAYGTPVVISGETVFFQVFNHQAADPLTGTSLFAIDGETGGTYYTTSLPYYSGQGDALAFPWLFAAGSTPWTVSLTLDTTGTTLYGVSGTSAAAGASIWAVPTSTGALNSNQINGGVSNVWAAPLISGDSLYVLGTTQLVTDTASGVSLLAYNKNDLAAGYGVGVTVLEGDTANTPFATPTISGNSLFVVDSTGGLTAYSTATLTAGGNDFLQYAAASAVTASPVTNGTYLAVTANYPASGIAGVTVFDLTNAIAAGSSVSWWFEWSATTIISTPAISSGKLFVAVDKADGGKIDTFNLAGHSGLLASPDYTTIERDAAGAFLGHFGHSSPIIKGDRLIIVSNGGTGGAGAAAQTPVLYNIDVSGNGANGNSYWRQFKFDAARTGENTAASTATTTTEDDNDLGCFISTIK